MFIISWVQYKKILGSVVLFGKGQGSHLYSNELKVEDACLKCPHVYLHPSAQKRAQRCSKVTCVCTAVFPPITTHNKASFSNMKISPTPDRWPPS